MSQEFSIKKQVSNLDDETINFLIKEKISSIGLFAGEIFLIVAEAAIKMDVNTNKKFQESLAGALNYMKEATKTTIITDKKQLLSYMNDIDVFFKLLPDEFDRETLQREVYTQVEEKLQMIISEAKQEIYERKKENGEIPIQLGYKK